MAHGHDAPPGVLAAILFKQGYIGMALASSSAQLSPEVMDDSQSHDLQIVECQGADVFALRILLHLIDRNGMS